MKRLITFILLIITSVTIAQTDEREADNQEIIDIIKRDQEIRMQEDVNYETVDKPNRLRILELFAEGKIKTKKDKERAAIILLHTNVTSCNDKVKSISPENYYLAYCLAKQAYGPSYLAATCLDRYLVYTKGTQKFGTQKEWDDKTEKFMWSPIDQNTTDEERKEYGVSSLEELKKEAEIKEI